MNLNGKILVFINVFENQGTLTRTYKTTISNKDKDGNYQNMSIDVKFAGTKFTSEKLGKLDDNFAHEIDVTTAFLSCREYTYKEGKNIRVPVIVVTDGKYIGKKEINKGVKEEDIPF